MIAQNPKKSSPQDKNSAAVQLSQPPRLLISLFLDDIRSVHNVGSIFRTSDAFCVERIFLSKTTPAPVDRFGRARADLAKVALGAEKSIPWELVAGDLPDVSRFAYVIALEQSPQSVSFEELREKVSVALSKKDSLTKKIEVLLVVGNEVDGVNPKIIEQADFILEIPMLGKKESLNVSVATGIALFGLRNI